MHRQTCRTRQNTRRPVCRSGRRAAPTPVASATGTTPQTRPSMAGKVPKKALASASPAEAGSRWASAQLSVLRRVVKQLGPPSTWKDREALVARVFPGRTVASVADQARRLERSSVAAAAAAAPGSGSAASAVVAKQVAVVRKAAKPEAAAAAAAAAAARG